MADAQDILDAIKELRRDLTVKGTTGVEDTVEKLYGHAKAADAGIATVKATIAAWAKDGVPAKLDVRQLTPEQLTQIATLFADRVVITGIQAKGAQFIVTFEQP